jgi:hypothetical protein
MVTAAIHAEEPHLSREAIEWCNVWIPDANGTKLPRVLLIGDSITVNDLYGLVKDHPEYWSGDGVHFNGKGVAVQGEQVKQRILENLVGVTSTRSASSEDCLLFFYFVGNGEDGLHLARSSDGYHWQALNGGRSFLGGNSLRAEPPDVRIRKKLIATGWDHPDAEQLVKHLAEMEKRPFDGVVLEVTGRTTDGKPCLLRETFANEKWQREWFQASVDQLRSCKFTRFTDNFVSIGANPGNIDWFDDEGWQRIIEHWRIAAWFVKHSGVKGLLFDPEPYTPPHSQFSYAAQPQRNEHTFNEYAAKARQRGRQVMQAAVEEYPGITIFCYFMNSVCATATGRADPKPALAAQGYGLYPAMIDGWLDVVPPTVTLVDGCESAYLYNSREQFLESATQIKGTCQELVSRENRPKYRAQVQVSYGIYLDAYWNLKDSPWYIDGLGGPRVERLRANTSAALSAADEYVWVYGERFRWWPTPNKGVQQKSWPEALPGSEQALRYARDPLDYARTEMARARVAGKLLNLTRNGDFGSPTAKSRDGAEQRWREGGPPAGWSAWQREDSKGTFTWDREAGAAGKGSAKATHVADGCFLQTYKAAPGQRYAVRAVCKTHGNGNTWLRVRWQMAEGRWTAENQDRLFYCEPASDKWQELFGVVEVPEGVGRLLILLGVGGQRTADDAAWFDDVELYELTARERNP